jgi:hypothetical protein
MTTLLDRGRAVRDGTHFTLELPTDLGLIDSAIGYLAGRLRDYGYEGSRLTLNFRVG